MHILGQTQKMLITNKMNFHQHRDDVTFATCTHVNLRTGRVYSKSALNQCVLVLFAYSTEFEDRIYICLADTHLCGKM